MACVSVTPTLDAELMGTLDGIRENAAASW